MIIASLNSDMLKKKMAVHSLEICTNFSNERLREQ